MTTYYTHTSNPDVRIKVTKKTVTWEHKQIINLDDVINGMEAVTEWRYYMRQPLPFYGAETLRTMYNLPDEVVAKRGCCQVERTLNR